MVGVVQPIGVDWLLIAHIWACLSFWRSCRFVQYIGLSIKRLFMLEDQSSINTTYKKTSWLIVVEKLPQILLLWQIYYDRYAMISMELPRHNNYYELIVVWL